MGKRHMPKTSVASRHYDTTIDNMIYLQEQGIRKSKLSKAMTRSAYAYTKAEQKRIFKANPCDRCGYFEEPEIGFDKVCKFPWLAPEEYDEAVYNYLPCVEAIYEED